MTDKTKNKCGFSECLVAYTYNEIEHDDKSAFEAHLPECETCSAELIELGMARSAVNEWYQKEFVTLATPIIELPIAETEAIPASNTAGWLDSLKQLFTNPPVWATAGGAFAVMFIMLGLFYWSSVVPSDKDVAGINKIVVTPTSLPATDNAGNKSNTPESSNDANSTGTNPGSTTGDKDDQKEIKPTAISSQNPASKQTDRIIKKDAQQIAPKQNQKAPVNKGKRKSSPSLLDSSTDEEETLRLSDLLEDITVSDIR